MSRDLTGGRCSRTTLALALCIGLVVASGCGRGSSSGDATRDGSSTSTTTAAPVTQIYDPSAGTRPAVAPLGTTTEGLITTPDGRQRHYRLYVPASASTGGDVPLLLALHGGLGTSEQFAINSGFDGLAESNRFIVVYPDGVGALPNGSGAQTWNGGYCCGAAARLDVDDVTFIRLLLDEIERRQPIDTARVYAAGHSNGAIMAYRLACELSDHIVAIGVQAGSLGVDRCVPSTPVSVFHLHGTADTNHPIDGGVGTGVAGIAFRSARDAVAALAAADGCTTAPVPGVDPDNPDLSVSTWTPCRDGAEVRFVTVAGASHAWMGHQPASAAAAALVGAPYPGLDASRAIWSFLSSRSRP